MTHTRLKLLFGTSLAALLLAGCMVGPKYHQPAATVQPPPAAYKELPAENPPAGQWKVAQPQETLLHGKWWEIYNDPELSALEDQLNINNQNIKVSFENLMEARTLVTQARAQLYPTLGTTPSFTRSQSSANLRNNVGATGTASGGTTTGNPNVYSTLTEAPFQASWEPDLWGKVRNTIRNAQYNAQLSAADLENERLTEQASLAVFFFELRDRYVCSWCELHGSQLILVPTPQSRGQAKHIRYPDDAIIVGRVTAVAMRIAETREAPAKTSPLS